MEVFNVYVNTKILSISQHHLMLMCIILCVTCILRVDNVLYFIGESWLGAPGLWKY